MCVQEDGVYWPAGAFVDLPDRKQWRDYYEVIEHPLSMSMIKEKIETNVVSGWRLGAPG